MRFSLFLNPCRCKRKKVFSRDGFSLFEIAIVLGIIGIVLGGIWAAMANVAQNNRINKTVQDITTTVQNVRTIYANQYNITTGAPGTTNITSAMVAAGAFPSDMMVGGIPQNQWGTNNPGADIPGTGVTLSADAGWGIPCDTRAPKATNVLEVVYWNMPPVAAVGVLSSFAQNAATTGAICLYCDGGDGWAPPSKATTAALSACGSPTANIVLYFKK